MRVHFIIHQDYEEAAACEEWAISRDYQISHSRVYLGDKLPESAAGFDMLVIMGDRNHQLRQLRNALILILMQSKV